MQRSLDQTTAHCISAKSTVITSRSTRVLLEANAYLRNPTSGYMGRRFFVLVEMLAPPNQVHTRSYKDDYFIVITPRRSRESSRFATLTCTIFWTRLQQNSPNR